MKLVRLTHPAGIPAPAASASGQWVPSGNLHEARDSPTLVTLPDGKVLAVDGGNEAFAIGNISDASAVEAYDPSTKTWALDTSAHVARRDHTATALPDGRVLVVGGFGELGYIGRDISPVAQLYDPATRTWTSEPGPDRVDHTATLLKSGKVLVVGGYNYSLISLPALLYQPDTHAWSETAYLPFSSAGGHRAALLHDGRVLIVGGVRIHQMEGPDIPDAAQIYEPVAGTWSQTSDLNFRRLGHTVTVLADGRVLVAGGAFGVAGSSEIAEIYDPATGRWTTTGSMGSRRVDHTASLLPNGNVLVTGGIIDGHLTDSAEIYDPVAGTWTQSTPLLTPRALHSAAVLANGDVLVVGGYGPPQDPSGANPVLANSELYGAAFPSGTIIPGLTGAWFDPTQRGHGILVEILPDARLLAWWFAFNPAGTDQSWFGGLGTYIDNKATITAVNQSTGGRFIPNFDPSKIVNNAWGMLTFTFTDCDHGRVDFASTAGYGTGSMNLTRLTRPAGLACP